MNTAYDDYGMRGVCIWWDWYLGWDQGRSASVLRVRGNNRGGKQIRS